MTFDGTTARMQISSCRVEMSGTYKCQIVNEFGKEESSAELIVIGNWTNVLCGHHQSSNFD